MPQDLADALERLARRPFRLRFDDAALERAYRQHVFDDELAPWLTTILGALVATGGLFVVVDALVVPDVFGLAAGLRLGLIVPVWGTFLVVALRGGMTRRRAQAWPVAGVLVAVATFVVLGVVADPPGSWFYLSYVAAFTLGGPPLGRWSLPVATAVNLVVPLGVLAALVIAPPDRGVITFVLVVNGIASAFGVFIGAVIDQFSRRSFLQQLLIERERRRAHDLLLNVLPAEIAARLSEDPSFIAERRDDVTVLFADIVGFTAVVAEVGAEAVIGPLNELFSRFDELADHHGVEKIKTIGDAYMVAGGLPVARPDHADAVLAMARDMLDAAHELGARLGLEVELRIGIHTGPVVAGVIGTRKFAYDLWGDTVNVASRMESHGAPGRIQVTDEVRRALHGGHDLEPRGAIDVRGRGPMQTWWVLPS